MASSTAKFRLKTRTVHAVGLQLVARECWLIEREEHRARGRAPIIRVEASPRFKVTWRQSAFSVATEFTVLIGKRSDLPRAMLLVARMQELQANMRGIQRHPRV
jgi:hypothetical protein